MNNPLIWYAFKRFLFNIQILTFVWSWKLRSITKKIEKKAKSAWEILRLKLTKKK